MSEEENPPLSLGEFHRYIMNLTDEALREDDNSAVLEGIEDEEDGNIEGLDVDWNTGGNIIANIPEDDIITVQPIGTITSISESISLISELNRILTDANQNFLSFVIRGGDILKNTTKNFWGYIINRVDKNTLRLKPEYWEISNGIIISSDKTWEINDEYKIIFKDRVTSEPIDQGTNRSIEKQKNKKVKETNQIYDKAIKLFKQKDNMEYEIDLD